MTDKCECPRCGEIELTEIRTTVDDDGWWRHDWCQACGYYEQRRIKTPMFFANQAE